MLLMYDVVSQFLFAHGAHDLALICSVLNSWKFTFILVDAAVRLHLHILIMLSVYICILTNTQASD